MPTFSCNVLSANMSSVQKTRCIFNIILILAKDLHKILKQTLLTNVYYSTADKNEMKTLKSFTCKLMSMIDGQKGCFNANKQSAASAKSSAEDKELATMLTVSKSATNCTVTYIHKYSPFKYQNKLVQALKTGGTQALRYVLKAMCNARSAVVASSVADVSLYLQSANLPATMDGEWVDMVQSTMSYLVVIAANPMEELSV